MTKHLAPVRIAFRKRIPNPGTVPLGKPEKALGHIYLRWVPAEQIARVSLLETLSKDYLTYEEKDPLEAGKIALNLTEGVLASYTRHQQKGIDDHLRQMRAFPPTMKVTRPGFRPLTVRQVHADFVDRVQREAQALHQSVNEGLQLIRLHGWATDFAISLPEFPVPNPWK